MKHLTALTTIAVTAAAVLAVGADPAGAVVCSTRQLTDTASPVDNRSPSLSDDGRRLVWTSNGEFGDFGDNQDGNREVWRYDTPDGPLPAEAVQVTNTSAGAAFEVAISGDGSRIVFRHTGDVGPGNADGNAEIWRNQVGTNVNTQVTTTTGGDNTSPAISDNGSLIVFSSNRNLGGQNPELNSEVFITNVGNASTNALTSDASAGSDSTAIAGLSNDTFFRSNGDLDPARDNPEHNRELFHTSGPTQLTTTTTGSNANPTPSDDGRFVAFSSTAPVVGPNPDTNFEVYLLDRTLGTTTRVTDTDLDNDDLGHVVGGIDDAGNRIAFNANGPAVIGADPVLDGEVYLHDRLDHPGTFAISDGGGRNAAINGDGTIVAFESEGDLTGENPDGNVEIFLATCGHPLRLFQDVGPNTAFYDQVQWMATAEVANGFPGGLFKPLDAVKRQQMANFLYNLAGRPEFTPPATPTFVDVPASNPFFLQIEWMTALHIADGFPNGTFKPTDPVKRQQMANFLYNLAGEPDFDPPTTPTFVDVPESNPFFLQVEWMNDEGIANGFPGGLFKPTDAVKRQQMANFLLNLVNGPGISLL